MKNECSHCEALKAIHRDFKEMKSDIKLLLEYRGDNRVDMALVKQKSSFTWGLMGGAVVMLLNIGVTFIAGILTKK